MSLVYSTMMQAHRQKNARNASENETQLFRDSNAHLLAEMERIDLLVQVQLHRARACHAGDPEFEGLVISETEVDSLLAKPYGLPRWADAAEAPNRSNDCEKLKLLKQSIDCRKQASREQGIRLYLEELTQIFGLGDFDVDILLVCLAPELDLRYEKLYAYLQDDVTKKRPSVDLILNLLCSSFEEKLEARYRFEAGAPLIDHQLLQVFVDPSQPEPPLLRRYVKPDDRITEFLLGENEIDVRIRPSVALVQSHAQFDQLLLPNLTKHRFQSIISNSEHGTRPIILYLQGEAGMGKQTTAEAICRECGYGLLVVEGRLLVEANEPRFDEAVHLIAREAKLQKAAIYWRDFDSTLGDDKNRELTCLLRAIESGPAFSFLAGQTAWEPLDKQLANCEFIRVEFTTLRQADRLTLWERFLAPEQQAADVNLSALSSRFRLSGGSIKAAAKTASNLAHWQNPEKYLVTSEHLFTACRLQSNRKLATLARKISPHYQWDDIVLPADRVQQLREICNQVKYRGQVYDIWGFDRKLSLGKGLNVLFAGPSGTGKTMAAEIIAGELGLDLYRIDLSTVISKYIGETEKNLARIFAEAETSNVILFFDEADALFGKRSEVRDSHDRYANIEISYLLQRMEEYEGVVILATNLHKNMDEAFVRRMQFTVEFPFPDASNRQRIWEKIWPAETPRSANLDFRSIAQRFELAGGNIRNIALAAAFLAADDGQVVSTNHLLRATQREYQKMGKVMLEADFGKCGELMAREMQQGMHQHRGAP